MSLRYYNWLPRNNCTRYILMIRDHSKCHPLWFGKHIRLLWKTELIQTFKLLRQSDIYFRYVTCSFVFREEIKFYSSSRACISWSAFMVWQWSAAECIQHHCTLIHRTCYQHVINGPVILIQSIMLGLPPAETGANSFSTEWQEDVYKAVSKKQTQSVLLWISQFTKGTEFLGEFTTMEFALYITGWIKET